MEICCRADPMSRDPKKSHYIRKRGTKKRQESEERLSLLQTITAELTAAEDLSIVEAHGGTITGKNASDRGARIVVRLPAARGEIQKSKAAA
jgi:signal transduction histidine kinase